MAVSKRSVLYAGFSQAKAPVVTATISAVPANLADLRGFGWEATGKRFFNSSRCRASASSTGACSVCLGEGWVMDEHPHGPATLDKPPAPDAGAFPLS
ncbi:hypothetical protein D3C80_1482180 [compost metagenome]